MLLNLLKKYKSILSYGFISVAVTVIDVIVTYIFSQILIIVIANSIGVITGGIIQYILNSKFVFHVKHDNKNFAIYAITFILGLILANLIIYFSNIIFNMYLQNENIVFLISKGLSIVIPFFALYFIRKELYKKFN